MTTRTPAVDAGTSSSRHNHNSNIILYEVHTYDITRDNKGKKKKKMIDGELLPSVVCRLTGPTNAAK